MPPERIAMSDEYIEEIMKAYEHFFFHYAASDLLIVNTTDIDFVERHQDLQELLRSLDPIKERNISFLWAVRKRPAPELPRPYPGRCGSEYTDSVFPSFEKSGSAVTSHARCSRASSAANASA